MNSKNWRDHFPPHPAAEAYPLMSEKELKELAEDIKKNGLRVPIERWSDKKGGKQYVQDERNGLDSVELAWPHLALVEEVHTDQGAVVPKLCVKTRALTGEESKDGAHNPHKVANRWDYV